MKLEYPILAIGLKRRDKTFKVKKKWPSRNLPLTQMFQDSNKIPE